MGRKDVQNHIGMMLLLFGDRQMVIDLTVNSDEMPQYSDLQTELTMKTRSDANAVDSIHILQTVMHSHRGEVL